MSLSLTTPLLDPRLPLTLRYPIVTPRGHRVERRRLVGSRGYRVHLVSAAGGEVYFEVAVYPDLTVQAAHAALSSAMVAASPDLETSPLRETTLAGRPAWRFRLRWPNRERVITFVPLDDALCRVIYDPASPLNERILATLSFVARSA